MKSLSQFKAQSVNFVRTFCKSDGVATTFYDAAGRTINIG